MQAKGTADDVDTLKKVGKLRDSRREVALRGADGLDFKAAS